MKTAKVKEHIRLKYYPKHTGKVWPHKRKVNSRDNKQFNDENKSFCKKAKGHTLHKNCVPRMWLAN